MIKLAMKYGSYGWTTFNKIMSFVRKNGTGPPADSTCLFKY